MSSWIIAMMLGASILLGGFGLWALLWGIKTGQFDDKNKFLDGALQDGEEALNDAVMMEDKKRKMVEKRKKGEYRPSD